MRYQAKIDSPIGTLTLVVDGDVLAQVRFPEESYVEGAEIVDVATHPVLRQAAAELAEYFDGTRSEFAVPLGPRGTAFQLAAWRALRTIPYGETVSYGEQARRLGEP
ncbi:MAG: MGMT family protein, partial [Aldersonia sp.]|nr:MGMT family protein [Aldersonia sp.]